MRAGEITERRDDLYTKKNTFGQHRRAVARGGRLEQEGISGSCAHLVDAASAKRGYALHMKTVVMMYMSARSVLRGIVLVFGACVLMEGRLAMLT